nr:hypothetical protein [Vibrio parahaemolyticus]
MDRRVIVGHWQKESVRKQLDHWCRAAIGWHESHTLTCCSFWRQHASSSSKQKATKVSAQNRVWLRSTRIRFG